MAGTFGDRVRDLQRIVGSGTLRGQVKVDQPYAQEQHEDTTLHHPHGGGPFYLKRALDRSYSRYYQAIADDLYRDGGKRNMSRSMVNLATTEMRFFVPVLYGNLRKSGAASAFDDGTLYFYRPPDRARLTPAEIAATSNGGL